MQLKNTQAVIVPEGCRWRLSEKEHEIKIFWDDNIPYLIEKWVVLFYAYMGRQQMVHLIFVQNEYWTLKNT